MLRRVQTYKTGPIPAGTFLVEQAERAGLPIDGIRADHTRVRSTTTRGRVEETAVWRDGEVIGIDGSCGELWFGKLSGVLVQPRDINAAARRISECAEVNEAVLGQNGGHEQGENNNTK